MSEPRNEANVDEREVPVTDAEEMVAEAEDKPVADEDEEVTAVDDDAETQAAEDVVAEEPEAPDLGAPLEAILFSSDLPLSAKRLGAWLKVGQREILEAIDQLNMFYGETGRAFRISPLAGGFQLVTTPEHAALLGKLHKERVPTRLSRAALETLSIIAFKQPVTRGEVDAIRGVSASDRVLRHLIERKLVRISGRAEAPGRPLLYGTTREFLGYFGLSAVADLPRTDELEALLAGDVPQDAIGAEESTEDLVGNGTEPSPEGAESIGEAAEVAMMEDPRSDEEAEEAPADVDEEDASLDEAEGGIAADLEDDLDGDEEDDDEDPSDDFDEDPEDELDDELAGELAEDSAAEERKSHSGEESDEHEGIPSPQ